MIQVKGQDTIERLCKAITWAAKTEKLTGKNGLISQLIFLDEYAGRENTVCELYPDFAPYSFSFVIKKVSNGDVWLNGGLIYTGPEQPGDGSAPALTVNLLEIHGWSVHT